VQDPGYTVGRLTRQRAQRVAIEVDHALGERETFPEVPQRIGRVERRHVGGRGKGGHEHIKT
jgi:hypothetical protein